MEINFWNLQMKACIFTKLKLFRNCFGGYFLLLFKLFHNCFRGYFLKLEQHRTVTLWNTNFCRTLFLQAALEMFVNICQILGKCLPLNSFLVKMQQKCSLQRLIYLDALGLLQNSKSELWLLVTLFNCIQALTTVTKNSIIDVA